MAAYGEDKGVTLNTKIKNEENGTFPKPSNVADKNVSRNANTTDQVHDSKYDDADIVKSTPKTKKRRRRPRRTSKEDSNSAEEMNGGMQWIGHGDGALEENQNPTCSVKSRDETTNDAHIQAKQDKDDDLMAIGQEKEFDNTSIILSSSKQTDSSQLKPVESKTVLKKDPQTNVGVLTKKENGTNSIQNIQNGNCEKNPIETQTTTLNRTDNDTVWEQVKGSNDAHRNDTRNSIKGSLTTDTLYDNHSKTLKDYNQTRKKKLYIVIGEPVSEHKRVNAYIKHRMGNSKPTEFTVESIKELTKWDKTSCCLIVVCFSSSRKANGARDKLHQSNINTTNKIRCYLSEDEAMDNVSKVQSDYGSLKKRHLEELLGVARDTIGKHDEKIIQMKVCLEELGRAVSNKRGIPLHQFQMLTSEKGARKEKLQELKRQRKVFTQYVLSIKRKIEESDANEKFEKDMKEIRKAFRIECRRLESALSMYSRREEILSTIQNNQVSVILGETGSGKSTQMVQYLYQAGFANEGRIVCTQPRKIAAVSLATHVAKELASSVGQVVGYQVGMHSKKTSITNILFTTDHALLNECLRDKDLSTYSCIIIDEAHERSINTDLLLGMLKDCIERRPELRVVITSATIDPDVFVSYFGGPEKCPVLTVSGRTYPVDVFWEAESECGSPFPEDYESKALNKAVEVHREHQVDHGDIIVFLTSAIETERCCEKFQRLVSGNDYTCLPLHGKLRAEEQNLVFTERAKGKRKIFNQQCRDINHNSRDKVRD